MQKASLAVSCILGLLVVYLAVTNLQPVTMSAFGAPAQVGLGLLPLSAIVIGAWAAASALGLRTTRIEGTEKKQEWEIQDAKLAASVRSDREKQLEAKIATLEAALKAALKKG